MNKYAAYRVRETNSLADRGFTEPDSWQKYLDTFADESVDWSDAQLAEITCLRLLSDRGYPVWDVSYCHGRLKDGTNVRVRLPFYQVPKRGMSRFIVECAKKEGVYAKGLGILSNISTLQ
jgi:hypothetical protein